MQGYLQRKITKLLREARTPLLTYEIISAVTGFPLEESESLIVRCRAPRAREVAIRRVLNQMVKRDTVIRFRVGRQAAWFLKRRRHELVSPVTAGWC